MGYHCLVSHGYSFGPHIYEKLFGGILYDGIKRVQHNMVPLVVIFEMLASIWQERNAVQYWGDRS